MLSMQREAGMAHQQDHKASAQRAHDAIAALTDAFCQKHLNDEYGVLCRRLVDALARKRPSPISRGKPDGWSSGIVRAIGWASASICPSLHAQILFAGHGRWPVRS